MKKVGIITIIDNDNYGNRLQNYALQSEVKKHMEVETIKNIKYFNHRENILNKCKNLLKYIKNEAIPWIFANKNRRRKFREFNANIHFSSRRIKLPARKTNVNYDYFIAGSDQIWKPTYLRMSEVDLLSFAEQQKRISYAASFGISQLAEQDKKKAQKEFKKFKIISVREDSGKKIVEELTGRTDVEVLVDPTMLLNAEEWDKVSKRPEQLDLLKSDKYILNYFLGELPEEWKNEINRIAKENNCEVINILDKKSPFYQTGPSEFLYLEKNAFMVCTDSFHSSVFSIIYDTPFVVFDRQQKGLVSMNSRIDTLLSKFKLEDRRFSGKIIEELLKCDYREAKELLKKEKEKSINFLKRALDIKEENRIES